MDFRTKIKTTQSSNQIKYSDTLLTIGSCFSKHIGSKLELYKFQVVNNVFGTLYNPISIFKSLLLSLDQHQIKTKDLILNGDVYGHWDFHSDFSSLHPEKVVEQTNQVIQETSKKLSTLNYIFISFGSAFAFTHNDKIVSNCHKFPADQFARIRLQADTIISEFSKVKSRIEMVNKNINWVFTVSPVRHIRDGLIDNQRSKSILIESCRQIEDQYENCSYFPSYEIMMDDLRDYRFYKADLIHPNEQAIDYIWDIFTSIFMAENTISSMNTINRVIQNVNHRAFNPDSDAHQKFVKNTLETIIKIQNEMESIDLTSEILQLESQLK